MIIKSSVLTILLIVANLFLGLACAQLQANYQVLFSWSGEMLRLAGQLLGTLFLVVILSALTAALVRPFWMTIIGASFSAVALLFAWGFGIVTLIAAVLYAGLLLFYAYEVKRGMENELAFSMRPLNGEYRTLQFALVFLLAVAIALAYRTDITRNNSLIPPAYRQLVTENMAQGIGGQFPDAARDTVIQEFRQQADQYWASLDRLLNPYLPYIPIFVGILASWILGLLFLLVSWFPTVLLAILFPVLKAAGFAKEVIEQKEVRRLTL